MNSLIIDFLFQETKLNHLESVVNISSPNSWIEKSDVKWPDRTQPEDINNLPRENWSMSQLIGNSTNNDWLIKNNWVQMAEMDKQATHTMESPQKNHSSSNFGLATNGKLNYF